MKVYIDGQFVDKEDAKISVFDHGLLYGDGIFEGIRIYDGNIFRLEEHLERFEFSAKALMLNLPWSRQEISEVVCESCRINGLTNGYIRLIATRGKGDLGLSPEKCPTPTLISIADAIELYPEEFYEQGLKIVTVPTRRTNPAALNPAIKSLNYLNNIMGKIEARQAGALEAIMLNDQGLVAECTGDNLFVLMKGKLFTPSAQQGALKGITRDTIFDIASELGVPIAEHELTRYDIWNSEECFLTGTGAEVIPVVALDGRQIGDGVPGEVFKRIRESFGRYVRTDGTRI